MKLKYYYKYFYRAFFLDETQFVETGGLCKHVFRSNCAIVQACINKIVKQHTIYDRTDIFDLLLV